MIYHTIAIVKLALRITKMQNRLKLALFTSMTANIFFVTSIAANAAELPQVTNQENTNVNLPITLPTQHEISQLQRQQTQGTSLTSTELEMLKNNPTLFGHFLNDALAAGDLKTVKALLPLYQQLKTNDPLLISYANAVLARANGNNKQAIAIYRQMLVKDKDMPPVQLSLAQALFADKQYKEAKQQFLALQNIPNLPPTIQQIVSQYINQINSQSKTHFSVEVGTTQGHDLNDTAQKTVDTLFGLQPIAPIDDKGLTYNTTIDKKLNVLGNYYIGIEGNAQATTYRNHHQYNDASTTIAPKIGYANTLTDINIQPSFTKRWYGGDSYNDQTAVSINANHWIKSNLRLGANAQYSHRHQDNPDAQLFNGNGLFIGGNGLYFINPQTYLIFGTNTYNHKTSTENDAYGYRQNTLYFGIGNEWTNALMTNLIVNDTRRKYHGIDTLFSSLNQQPMQKRLDNLYGVNFEIWKNNWKILGLVPKLTVSYNQTNSNYPWYDRKGTTDVNFFISKNF